MYILYILVHNVSSSILLVVNIGNAKYLREEHWPEALNSKRILRSSSYSNFPLLSHSRISLISWAEC